MIIFNDLDAGTSCTFHKTANDTKLGGGFDRLGVYAAIQKGLDRLEKWTKRYLIEPSKGKCRVPFLERTNPRHRNKLPRKAVQPLSWEILKNLTGHILEQAVIAEPAWAGVGLDWVVSRGACQPQPSCDWIYWDIALPL